MITIAKTSIRSTNTKHLWKIGDKTVFEICVNNLLDTKLIDYIFIWIDDRATLPVLNNNAVIYFDRPKDMIHYGNSLTTIPEWQEHFEGQIREFLGRQDYDDITINFHFNINLALISPATYQTMYFRLMEDPSANNIFPVAHVKPHLFIENPRTGYLFPVWHQVSLDRQKYPNLYRQIGSYISHLKRPVVAGLPNSLWHVIPQKEAIDIETKEDLEMTEYFYRNKEIQ